MAGKGDKPRKGANDKAYYENYDKIFNKEIKNNFWQVNFIDGSFTVFASYEEVNKEYVEKVYEGDKRVKSITLWR